MQRSVQFRGRVSGRVIGLALCAIEASASAWACGQPGTGATQPATQTTDSNQPSAEPSRPVLADAPELERQTLERMLADGAWARRAIAAIRLERYGCPASQKILVGLLRDPVWQVRAFAIRSLARRGAPQEGDWLAEEDDLRVIRAALRHRYRIESDRLARAIRILSKSSDLEDKMLAVEIAAASGDKEWQESALETVRQVILKMDRVQAGVFSSRLAALLKQPHLRTRYDWQHWLLKTGRGLAIHECLSPPQKGQRVQPSQLAALEPEQFSGLEDYMTKLGERQIDLAICLDCTASMSGEIAAAQAGIDDMMLFVSGLVESARMGLVAYRDQKDEFETKAWDFTNDLDALRKNLWQLSAEGGGDHPEAVYPAMKLACMQLGWRAESAKILILVGDAPPHVGFGARCVSLAERAREQSKLTVHAIQAENKEVKHFAEIAAAGGGRCVSLEDDDLLMAEIAGLTLGDRYRDELREFFQIYLELCR
ncbi:MAG: HEAT repeat domain-containing protein [Phycisphaerales bacterium]|nr:HEAT repeat domain-containing protein [Phycisphaerales bacterium]